METLGQDDEKLSASEGVSADTV